MVNRIDYPAIDGLRILAFLLVFFGHFSIFIPSPFLHAMGWTGVQLFFLISGFLLTRLLETEYRQTGQLSLKKYFIRRMLRIWPLYFFYLLLVTGLCLLYYRIGVSGFRLAGNVFFMDNWISGFRNYNNNFATTHLWSISLEEQFYAALPFLLLFLLPKTKKTQSRFLLAGFIGLFLFRLLFLELDFNYPFIYTSPFAGDCFLAGMALGAGYNEQRRKIPAGLLFAAGAALLAFLYYFIPPKEMNGYHQLILYPLLALAFAAILLAALQVKCRPMHLFFNNRMIRYLGRISFGLYIFHYGILLHVNYFFLQQHPEIAIAWSLPVALAITVLFAILSYEWLEKPWLRRKQKFTVIRNYRF